MDKALAKPQESLGLDPNLLTKLTSYEDFLSYYIQLSQTHDSVSWIKADLLVLMQMKLGKTSLAQLSKDLKQPASTVSTYIRTSKAFPTEKRDALLSFTVHLQASYADSYDEKNQVFTGNKRFEWLNKAADQSWSSRKLLAEIQEEKTADKPIINKPCSHCGQIEKKTKQYHLFCPGSSMRVKKFYLDDDCLLTVIDFIYVSKKEPSQEKS